jgi:hypothetical protein
LPLLAKTQSHFRVPWPVLGNPASFTAFTTYAEWRAFVLQLSLHPALPQIVSAKRGRKAYQTRALASGASPVSPAHWRAEYSASRSLPSFGSNHHLYPDEFLLECRAAFGLAHQDIQFAPVANISSQ